MFDITKLATAATDLDSRLEQIANQGKLTNALLALQIMQVPLDANLSRILLTIISEWMEDQPKQPFAPTGLNEPHRSDCVQWSAREEDGTPIDTITGAYIHDQNVECICTCHRQRVPHWDMRKA